MTVRELYEYALIELNKLKAPSLLLEDYNYFINKAVQQYINLIYNKYDVNQQTTDDLRVLKTTAILEPKKLEGNISKITDYETKSPDVINYPADGVLKATYYVTLPEDYVHLLGCVVEYEVKHTYKCYNPGNYVSFEARRLTSDMFGSILHNAYMRPMYKRPYYFINNFNTQTGFYKEIPYTNKLDENLMNYNRSIWEETASANEVKVGDYLVDSLTAPGNRRANASEVRMELRFGNDDNVFKPYRVYVDYVKAPMFIRLTMDDINQVADKTAILEWPDYVCFEIVNIFTRLIMENASDPRLQTNPAVNKTIADPAGMQPEQQGKK